VLKTNTLDQYNVILGQCRDLLSAKNADYGDSWRLMRFTTIVDQIKVKLARIDRLDSGHEPHVSEGIESELRDILNYAALALIKREEQNARD
jgi:hypothetical protein